MNTEELSRMKKRLGYTYAQIAAMSGVPESTVQKVISGSTKSPGVDAVYAIERVLGVPEDRSGSMVAEQSALRKPDAMPYQEKVPEWALTPKYPKQGYYTVIDYLNLPDDQRVELIDGVIYDMAAPTSVHQDIAGRIYAQLLSANRNHPGCHVYISPIDVQLNRDDRTMVQPDVVVICNPHQVTRKRIIGPPDFVVEILSQSTRKKDLQIKLGKYARAGVSEYWMIDPDARTIMVCIFGEENTTRMYTFDDMVPVYISDGEVSIDFGEISRDMYEVEEDSEVDS